MTQDTKTEYLLEVRQLHKELEKRWRRNRNYYTALQVVIVGGAALVATLLNTQVPKEIAAIISIFVVIATVASNLSRFDQRSHINRLTAATLDKEIRLYDFKRGTYKELNEEQAFDHFMDAIENVKDDRMNKIIAVESSAYGQAEPNREGK